MKKISKIKLKSDNIASANRAYIHTRMSNTRTRSQLSYKSFRRTPYGQFSTDFNTTKEMDFLGQFQKIL